MKIHIPNSDGLMTKVGGGWSFTRNFLSRVPNFPLEMADVFFITAPTLVKRDEVDKAKNLGKKIALRVDGVPEDWRNRGTGWSRLKDFSKDADLVIYQSDFIKNTVGRLLDKDGAVIYNGVNTQVFKPMKAEKWGNPSILYCNYRKGENNKRVEEAIERFRYYKLDNPEATMTFVGLFSKAQFLWNNKSWDFGMLDMEEGKDWRYLKVLTDRQQLANIMAGSDFIAFPSFADPCPNTLIEAMSCGCKPLWINDYGGQADIVRLWDDIDWSADRMVDEYISAFEGVL